MRNPIYAYIAAASLVILGLVGMASAQGSQGDTSLTYDDQTGMVTGYAETTNDLDTDYTTDAWLSVVDQNNVVVASTSALRQTGTASVTLQFEGTPGSVYTATASHCLRLETSDYNSAYPWGVFYYDNWYMSSLIAQQINSQWAYWFGSPGYTETHRPTDVICIGKTHDSVTAAPQVTFSNIGSIEQGGSKDITATVTHKGNNQITLYLKKSNSTSTSGATFSDGTTTKLLGGGNGAQTVTIKGVTTSDNTEDYKIEARYGTNDLYLAGYKPFTVSSLTWGENSSCSGFDNSYLLVPKSGTNKANSYIAPSGATGNFKLEVVSTPTNNVSVSPATITTNNTAVTVTSGTTVGNFTVNASANQQNTSSIAQLNIYARNRINKTLTFYAVTENATNTPPPSSNIPTASGLQTYLNDTWGKQANVYFAVTKGSDFGVHYDLDNDGKIDSTGDALEPLTIFNAHNDSSSFGNLYFLGLGVKPLSNGQTPAAFSKVSVGNYQVSFIGPSYVGTRDYISAHEIGHLLGVPGRQTDNTFLMYESDVSASPCKVGKDEWDIVNP